MLFIGIIHTSNVILRSTSKEAAKAVASIDGNGLRENSLLQSLLQLMVELTTGLTIKPKSTKKKLLVQLPPSKAVPYSWTQHLLNQRVVNKTTGHNLKGSRKLQTDFSGGFATIGEAKNLDPNNGISRCYRYRFLGQWGTDVMSTSCPGPKLT
jgi:hypothetical protein